MEIIAVAGGMGLGALSLAFNWWLANWARDAEKRCNSQADRRRQLEIHNGELMDALKDRDEIIDQFEEALARSESAHEGTTETLENVLNKLSETGNAEGVAVGIRAQLERLRNLQSEKVSSVPGPTSGEDRDDKGAVHVPAGGGD